MNEEKDIEKLSTKNSSQHYDYLMEEQYKYQKLTELNRLAAEKIENKIDEKIVK